MYEEGCKKSGVESKARNRRGCTERSLNMLQEQVKENSKAQRRRCPLVY